MVEATESSSLASMTEAPLWTEGAILSLPREPIAALDARESYLVDMVAPGSGPAQEEFGSVVDVRCYRASTRLLLNGLMDLQWNSRSWMIGSKLHMTSRPQSY